MSAFDFMCFAYDEGGSDSSFVVNANKFSRQEALDICLSENDYKFDKDFGMRKPMISDVLDASVAFRFGVDGWEKGCYTFVENGSKGSFPVYVIDFSCLS